MPTLSSEPPRSSGSAPHHDRRTAESFGGDAERYDRTRPPYPGALVASVVAASPGRALVDVGCGTGIAARQFRAAGCDVLGVEPDARMAAFARDSGVLTEVATFESWDPAGRGFDAVVAGQAWHWVDPVAGAVKAGRVLRPGGRLALFWHVFQLPDPVVDALVSAFGKAAPDAGIRLEPMRRAFASYQALTGPAADGIRAAGSFDEPEHSRFDWERRYTRAEWLDQLPTTGALTRLSADRLAGVLDEVGAAIDGLGGSFTMPYATVMVSAARVATG
jgi:SAM-dependent methyltransferase